jgi:hypothetical protein
LRDRFSPADRQKIFLTLRGAILSIWRPAAQGVFAVGYQSGQATSKLALRIGAAHCAGLTKNNCRGTAIDS